MARRPGVSKSTFYREWRRRREGELQDVVLDLTFPGVIKRSEFDQVLAAEREARERELNATRPATPSVGELRAMGKSELRAHREAAGISLDDLCALIGIPRAHLIQMESGTRKVTDEQRARIIEAIQLSLKSGS